MDEKRRHKRNRRRLTIRFGEHDLSRPGFTYDVSLGGAFILSDSHPPLGRRVHLQMFFEKDTFLLFEAMAVREKQVPPEMRSVVRGGFAVRFMSAEELMYDRLTAEASAVATRAEGAPARPAQTAPLVAPSDRTGPPSSAAAAPRVTGSAPAGVPPSAPAVQTPSRTPAIPAAVPPTGSDALARLMGSQPAPAADPAPRRAESSLPPQAAPRPSAVFGQPAASPGPATARDPNRPFVVTYRSLDDLRRAHRAELRHGGVFVPTDDVRPLESAVRLEFRMDFASARIQCAARVVHVGSGNGPRGIGVVFSADPRVLAQLERLLT